MNEQNDRAKRLADIAARLQNKDWHRREANAAQWLEQLADDASYLLAEVTDASKALDDAGARGEPCKGSTRHLADRINDLAFDAPCRAEDIAWASQTLAALGIADDGRPLAERIAAAFEAAHAALDPVVARRDAVNDPPLTLAVRATTAAKIALDLVDERDAKASQPSSNKRPENGAMRFGNDWAGVFLRGDYAAPMAMQLGMVLDTYAKGNKPGAISLMQARGFLAMLAGCDERGSLEGLQQMRPFDECVSGGYLTASLPALNIDASGDSPLSLATDVLEQASFVYRNYGCASDNALTEDAQRLKRNVLAMFPQVFQRLVRTDAPPVCIDDDAPEEQGATVGDTAAEYALVGMDAPVAREPLMVEAPTLLATVEAQLPKVPR